MANQNLNEGDIVLGVVWYLQNVLKAEVHIVSLHQRVPNRDEYINRLANDHGISERQIVPHGPDVIASGKNHSGDEIEYVVECKGQGNEQYLDLPRSTLKNHFDRVISSIVRHFNGDPKRVLVVALPDDDTYRSEAKRLPEPLRKALRLKVWFRDEDGLFE